MRSRRYVGLTNLFFFLLSAGRELSTVAAVFVYLVLVDQQTVTLHLLNNNINALECRHTASDRKQDHCIEK